jgi:transcriptional regulator with XRE-family HTH domain
MSKRGLNNVKLAEMVGVHPHYISDIRRGAKEPSKTLIIALAAVLETTVAELQKEVQSG